MGLLSIIRKLNRNERSIRLLLLGLDNAGKTTIVTAFQFNGDRSQLSEIQPTLGFNIISLKYTVKEDDEVNKVEDEIAQREKTRVSNPSESKVSASPIAPSIDDLLTSNADLRVTNLGSLIGRQYKLNIWDVGGQRKLRSYWRNYFESTAGLIFVIDSTDSDRINEVGTHLSELMSEEKLQGASLLIFANKQDMEGAMETEEIKDKLGLKEGGRLWDAMKNRNVLIVGTSAFTGKGLTQGINWIVKDIAGRIYMLD